MLGRSLFCLPGSQASSTAYEYSGNDFCSLLQSHPSFLILFISTSTKEPRIFIPLSLSIQILSQCKGESADLCYIMVNFGFLISENEGLCSCAQIPLLDYIEEKWGQGHMSFSHPLFILLRVARRSYSCAQRKQAWPLCQMASELSKVIMQLGEDKAFLSESCCSFPWLHYDNQCVPRFATSTSTSKERILHCKSQRFHSNEWLCAWNKN